MTTAVRLTHLNRCIIVIVLLNSTHGEKPVQVPTETTGSQNCSSAGLAANQQNAKANTTQYVWIILMLVLPAAEPDRSERETHCAVLEAGRYVSRERTFTESGEVPTRVLQSRPQSSCVQQLPHGVHRFVKTTRTDRKVSFTTLQSTHMWPINNWFRHESSRQSFHWTL